MRLPELHLEHGGNPADFDVIEATMNRDMGAMMTHEDRMFAEYVRPQLDILRPINPAIAKELGDSFIRNSETGMTDFLVALGANGPIFTPELDVSDNNRVDAVRVLNGTLAVFRYMLDIYGEDGLAILQKMHQADYGHEYVKKLQNTSIATPEQRAERFEIMTDMIVGVLDSHEPLSHFMYTRKNAAARYGASVVIIAAETCLLDD